MVICPLVDLSIKQAFHLVEYSFNNKMKSLQLQCPEFKHRDPKTEQKKMKKETILKMLTRLKKSEEENAIFIQRHQLIEQQQKYLCELFECNNWKEYLSTMEQIAQVLNLNGKSSRERKDRKQKDSNFNSFHSQDSFVSANLPKVETGIEECCFKSQQFDKKKRTPLRNIEISNCGESISQMQRSNYFSSVKYTETKAQNNLPENEPIIHSTQVKENYFNWAKQSETQTQRNNAASTISSPIHSESHISKNCLNQMCFKRELSMQETGSKLAKEVLLKLEQNSEQEVKGLKQEQVGVASEQSPFERLYRNEGQTSRFLTDTELREENLRRQNWSEMISPKQSDGFQKQKMSEFCLQSISDAQKRSIPRNRNPLEDESLILAVENTRLRKRIQDLESTLNSQEQRQKKE